MKSKKTDRLINENIYIWIECNHILIFNMPQEPSKQINTKKVGRGEKERNKQTTLNISYYSILYYIMLH